MSFPSTRPPIAPERCIWTAVSARKTETKRQISEVGCGFKDLDKLNKCVVVFTWTVQTHHPQRIHNIHNLDVCLYETSNNTGPGALAVSQPFTSCPIHHAAVFCGSQRVVTLAMFSQNGPQKKLNKFGVHSPNWIDQYDYVQYIINFDSFCRWSRDWVWHVFTSYFADPI